MCPSVPFSITRIWQEPRGVVSLLAILGLSMPITLFFIFFFFHVGPCYLKCVVVS
ncbi:hypothetical protein Hanom_Chr09g00867411 [Helianthus anomalus]